MTDDFRIFPSIVGVVSGAVVTAVSTIVSLAVRTRGATTDAKSEAKKYPILAASTASRMRAAMVLLCAAEGTKCAVDYGVVGDDEVSAGAEAGDRVPGVSPLWLRVAIVSTACVLAILWIMLPSRSTRASDEEGAEDAEDLNIQSTEEFVAERRAKQERSGALSKGVPMSGGEYRCAYETASWPSRLTFYWISPLLTLASKRDLSLEDVWAPPQELQARRALSDLELKYAAEVKAARAAGRDPSLLRALLSFAGWQYYLCIIPKLMNDAGQFVGPLMLRQLVEFASDPSLPASEGFKLTGILVGLLLLATLGENTYFFYGMRVCQRARSAVTQLVYRKAMRLSHAGWKETSRGQLASFVSTDAKMIEEGGINPFVVLGSLLRVVVCLILLYGELGGAAFVGAVVLIILVPIQGKMMMMVQKYMKATLKASDARLRSINEALAGIEVIKLYAWEEAMRNQIADLREKELVYIRKLVMLRAANFALMGIGPILVSVIAFAVYTSDPDNVFDAATAFTSIALFNVLRFPLIFLPMSLAGVVSMYVSINRIGKLMLADEEEPRDSTPLSRSAKHVSSIKDSVFEWEGAVENSIDADADEAGKKKDDEKREAAAATASAAAADEKKEEGKGKEKADEEAPAAVDNSIEEVNDKRVFRLTVNKAQVPVGKLTAIIGKTGSGKSSLVQAMLGQMRCIKGEGKLLGRVSYAAQLPWIVNDTVEGNILFGREYDEERFRQAVHDACFTRELAELPAGQRTEIGERGVNLSGGQKARVALARAMYAVDDVDVFIFDDPLSALDAKVARAVFDRCMGPNSRTRNKTRILATNRPGYAAEADVVVCIERQVEVEVGAAAPAPVSSKKKSGRGKKKSGREQEEPATPAAAVPDLPESVAEYVESAVVAFGEPRDVRAKVSDDLVELLAMDEAMRKTSAVGSHVAELDGERAGDDAGADSDSSSASGRRGRGGRRGKKGGAKKGSTATADAASTVDAEAGKGDAAADASAMSGKSAASGKADASIDKAFLVEREEKARGAVKAGVYIAFLRAGGGAALGLLVLLFFVAIEVGRVSQNYWLSNWTDKEDPSQRVSYYMGIYAAIAMSVLFLEMVNTITIARASIRASRAVHDSLIGALFRAPLSFFEATPVGRIMNRCSSDVQGVDMQLPWSVQAIAGILLSVVGSVVVVSQVTPPFVALFMPVFLIFLSVQNFFRYFNREFKRLDAISRSPVHAHVSESLDGLSTIKSFDAVERWSERLQDQLDVNLKMVHGRTTGNRWLGLRLDVLGAVIVGCAALLAVLSRSTLASGAVALSITYSLSWSQMLTSIVRISSEAEVSFNAMERILHYQALKPERVEGAKPPTSWPSKGVVRFEKVTMRYRAHLEPALRDMTFTLNAGEKVGVVGRTGAGKSSIAVALFRTVEPLEGSIYIDDVELGSITLNSLRSSIGIIPQDPVLFRGNIRKNVDPFGQYEDEAVWEALRSASLGDRISTLADEVSEGGSNFSIGERQLVCLARAILKKAKVLVVDECTANVDALTDAVVQRALRSVFVDSTVLTIAHRLKTLMSSDRIAVVDAGRIVEFDTPLQLLADDTSHFSELARHENLKVDVQALESEAGSKSKSRSKSKGRSKGGRSKSPKRGKK
jgi:ABC-type multidrug transport system fused ATPase/permease subunit